MLSREYDHHRARAHAREHQQIAERLALSGVWQAVLAAHRQHQRAAQRQCRAECLALGQQLIGQGEVRQADGHGGSGRQQKRRHAARQMLQGGDDAEHGHGSPEDAQQSRPQPQKRIARQTLARQPVHRQAHDSRRRHAQADVCGWVEATNAETRRHHGRAEKQRQQRYIWQRTQAQAFTWKNSTTSPLGPSKKAMLTGSPPSSNIPQLDRDFHASRPHALQRRRDVCGGQREMKDDIAAGVACGVCAWTWLE